MSERTFKNDTYYWVIAKGENKWAVAHHTTAGLFYMTGTSSYFAVEEMLEIGEEIKPPEEPLKKCPFCGGISFVYTPGIQIAYVLCKNCTVKGPKWNRVVDAIAAWNKRTP